MDTTIIDSSITQEEEFFFAKPPLIQRIKSTIIDTAVIFILMLIASKVLQSLDIESGSVNAILIVLILLYEPICISLGKTLGQKITGLKVSRLNNYIENGETKKLNFFLAFARYMSKVLLGWISLLTIHSDKYGQAIHDKIGSSVMLYD